MRPLMLVTVLATSSLALAACTNAGQASTSTTTAPAAGVAATSTTAGSAAGKAALDPAVAALVPADIKAKGQLSFAMDASYAPFEYFDTDNKTIIGFDADLSQAIGTTMGIKVNDVNAAFDSILIGLTSQKYDVGMSAFSASAERAKVVDFVTYGAGGSRIAVPKGNPKALSMDPMTLCGRTVGDDVDAMLEGVDAVMTLRLQRERMVEGLVASLDDYHRDYGLTAARLQRAAGDAIVMHPGPMNRGIEISDEVADGPQSRVLRQVANGVAVRMAVLEALLSD